MNDTVSTELQLRIETVVLDCLLKAQDKWGQHRVTFIPEIRYDTKGRAAGWAHFSHLGPHWIRINPILLNENVEYVVNQTVPHEIAHLVAYTVFGTRIKPHGHEWKFVMRVFGKEPKRCHRLDVTSVQRVRRAVTRITFHCDKCKQPLEITQNRYTKMMNGKVYVHRGCGGRISSSVVATNRLY